MKKITAFVLLSIAIISCNKETKTVTKVDPKTGKTITVEVPAEKSGETATVANPAIKDSLGIYYSTFKLEKGKTYPFRKNTNSKILLSSSVSPLHIK